MKKNRLITDFNFFYFFKKIFPIAIFIGLIFAAISLVFYLKNPNTLNFRHVKIVTSDHHIPNSDLQSVIALHLHGGFFSLNVRELKEAFLQMPWVHEVSFRRTWPDRLEINVVEQQAMASWNDKAIINTEGELFQPDLSTMPKNLPLLEGDEESLPNMVQWFQEFSRSTSSIGMKITAMRLTKRHSLQVMLTSHLRVVLGREDVEQRFAQFVNLFPQLIGKEAGLVDYVDCRYPNGLAIKWQNAAKHR